MPKFSRTGYQFGCLERKKRKNGPDVWVFRYRDMQANGTQVHRSVVVGTVEEYPTKAAAWKAAESLRMSANPDSPAQVTVTFRAVADRYKTEELPELRHSTQLAYSSYLEQHILSKWGDYPVTGVKPFAVEQWLKTLSLAPKTRGNISNVMPVLFDSAMRWELMEIQENPMKLVRVKGVGNREKEPIMLTLPQCHLLLAELGQPYRTMVALDMATGLRVSELLALKWSDFDWQNSVMLVRRSIVDAVPGDVKTKYSKAGLPLERSTSRDDASLEGSIEVSG